MAFHKVLERSREWAAKRDLERFLEASLWLYRSCGRCHEVAAAAGLLEKAPPPERPPSP